MEELEKQAMNLFIEHRKASVTFLQREMSLTYRAAHRVMRSLEAKGLVTKADQNGRRRLVGVGAAVPEPVQAEAATPATGSEVSTAVSIELRDEDEDDASEIPELLRKQPQPKRRPHANPEAEEAPAWLVNAFAAVQGGVRRAWDAVMSIDSVSDPRLHILFACLATFLFGLGQFLGGVCIIAYGLAMTRATDGRQ